MPIPFTCPHCGAQSVVADQFAGQDWECPSCKHAQVMSANQPGAPVKSKIIAPLIISVFLICGGFLLLVGYSLLSINSAFKRATEARNTALSQNNLRQIAIALQVYVHRHKAYPPATVTDPKTGKPLYSWRVLLLDQVAPEIAAKFDRTQAWDSETNRPLSESFVSIYHAPNDDSLKSSSSYFAVIDPEERGVFNSLKAMEETYVFDHLRETLLLIEAHGSNVSWAAPCDLDLQTMQPTNGHNFQPKLNPHADKTNILLADGSVHLWLTTELKEILWNLVVCNDGKRIAIPD